MLPKTTLFAAANAGLRAMIGALALVLATGCGTASRPAAAPTPSGETAFQIYDSRGQLVTGTSALADALRGADVVFLGEQHDDSIAHRFQLELVQALSRNGRPVTLALEMFERDVQPTLNAYVAGTLPEPQFLEAARPWPNYATDYRPLVEWARAQGWPVIGSNVPRPLAAAVAQHGLPVLEAVDPARRGLAAWDVQCADDAYFQRFAREMQHHAGSHGPGGSEGAAMVLRLFEAQCLKDETMAESILDALSGNRVIVHVNGAFHSDYRQGIVSRVQRRDPDLEIAVISLIPATDIRDPDAVRRHQGVADYLVLTSGPTP